MENNKLSVSLLTHYPKYFKKNGTVVNNENRIDSIIKTFNLVDELLKKNYLGELIGTLDEDYLRQCKTNNETVIDELIKSTASINSNAKFGKKTKKYKNVVHIKKKTSKGWSKEAKKLNRSKMPKSHFLDSKRRKYPYYNSRGKIDCRALLASRQRAFINKDKSIVKKANNLGKKYGCSWAT